MLVSGVDLKVTSTPHPSEVKGPPLSKGQLLRPIGKTHPGPGLPAGLAVAIARAETGRVSNPRIPRKDVGTSVAYWHWTALN